MVGEKNLAPGQHNAEVGVSARVRGANIPVPPSRIPEGIPLAGVMENIEWETVSVAAQPMGLPQMVSAPAATIALTQEQLDDVIAKVVAKAMAKVEGVPPARLTGEIGGPGNFPT